MRRTRFNASFLMLVIFMSIANASCKRQEDPHAYLYKLPEATSIGANTFGCICNGEIYSVRREIEGVMFGSYPTDIKVEIRPKYIMIKARSQRHLVESPLPKSWVSLTLFCDPKSLKPGRYTDVYRSVPGSDSYVEITRFDEYVLSGTFRLDKYSLLHVPETVTDRGLYDIDRVGVEYWDGTPAPTYIDSTVVDTYIHGRFDIQLSKYDFSIEMNF